MKKAKIKEEIRAYIINKCYVVTTNEVIEHLRSLNMTSYLTIRKIRSYIRATGLVYSNNKGSWFKK